MVFELPSLALRPATEVRRIEQDPVIALLRRASRRANASASSSTMRTSSSASPEARALSFIQASDVFDAVDVRHREAALGRDQARRAGVAEEIEQFRSLERELARASFDPTPVAGLLGEQADVLEGRRPQAAARAIERDRPLGRVAAHRVRRVLRSRQRPRLPLAVEIALEREVRAIPGRGVGALEAERLRSAAAA